MHFYQARNERAGKRAFDPLEIFKNMLSFYLSGITKSYNQFALLKVLQQHVTIILPLPENISWLRP